MAASTKAAFLSLFAWIVVSAQTPGSGNGADPSAAAPVKASSDQCTTRLPEDYAPLTHSERYALWVNSLIRPRELAFTIARAAVNHALDRPYEWGGGAEGFGHRLASAYFRHGIDASFLFGIAFLRDEDNRYFNSGKQGFGSRLWYAITSSFLARHDNGSRSISVSALAGPAAGSIISLAWQPPNMRNASTAAISYGVSEGGHVAMNVAREFLPHFLGRLLP